jgi:hypothetical protein
MLNGTRIGVPVGQVKAAGVPQHMRMDRKGQGGSFARPADHVVDRTPRERRRALREEYVRPTHIRGFESSQRPQLWTVMFQICTY